MEEESDVLFEDGSLDGRRHVEPGCRTGYRQRPQVPGKTNINVRIKTNPVFGEIPGDGVEPRLEVCAAVEEHVGVPPALLAAVRHPLDHVVEHLRHVLAAPALQRGRNKFEKIKQILTTNKSGTCDLNSSSSAMLTSVTSPSSNLNHFSPSLM